MRGFLLLPVDVGEVVDPVADPHFLVASVVCVGVAAVACAVVAVVVASVTGAASGH